MIRLGSALKVDLVNVCHIGRFGKCPSQRSIPSGSVLIKDQISKGHHMGQLSQGPAQRPIC